MHGFSKGQWAHHSQTHFHHGHGHGHHGHGHDKSSSQSPVKPTVVLTPVPGTAYKVVSALNQSFVLTLKQEKGHHLVIDTFQNLDSQKFTFTPEHGKYFITSAFEDRKLSVDDDSHKNGAHIEGSRKLHKSGLFQVLPITAGPLAGKGVGFKTASGKALDINAGQAVSGTQIIQWDFHGGNNQIWILVPLPPVTYYNTKTNVPALFISQPNQVYKIVSVLDWSLVLTVKNQGNHALSLQKYTGDPTQQFHIYQENKKSAFVVVSSNSALCIFKDSKENKGEIRSDAGNHTSSWFEVVPVTHGQWTNRAYILRTFAGKTVDIFGGVAKTGIPVVQWEANGGNNQSWLIVRADQVLV